MSTPHTQQSHPDRQTHHLDRPAGVRSGPDVPQAITHPHQNMTTTHTQKSHTETTRPITLVALQGFGRGLLPLKLERIHTTT